MMFTSRWATIPTRPAHLLSGLCLIAAVALGISFVHQVSSAGLFGFVALQFAWWAHAYNQHHLAVVGGRWLVALLPGAEAPADIRAVVIPSVPPNPPGTMSSTGVGLTR